RDTFIGLASEFRITAELAFDARQEIFVSQSGQAHRDRVNEDDFVAGARELAHEMGFGMRVVIPPIFTAKADYRAIPEHRILIGYYDNRSYRAYRTYYRSILLKPI